MHAEIVTRAWESLSFEILRITGRRLVGTDGGLYAFTANEVRVPGYDIEAATHELCHWIAADDRERCMPNLDMSIDSQHPEYTRMVEREESAWALEFWLFGDPKPRDLMQIMTPESIASGAGLYVTYEASKRAPLPWGAAAEASMARALDTDGTLASIKHAMLARASCLNANVIGTLRAVGLAPADGRA